MRPVELPFNLPVNLPALSIDIPAVIGYHTDNLCEAIRIMKNGDLIMLLACSHLHYIMPSPPEMAYLFDM